MTIRPLRSSIIVSYKIQARFETKINWAEVQKKYIVCKVRTSNLRSSKNYILQTKALMWNEGFPGNFFAYKTKCAHTEKHARQGLHIVIKRMNI